MTNWRKNHKGTAEKASDRAFIFDLPYYFLVFFNFVKSFFK
jgi:hypothetical protein